MRKQFLLMLTVLGFCSMLTAQNLQNNPGSNHGNKFEQLGTMLPTPNEYRTASGAPGPKYWQQRCDYDIKAELDEPGYKLKGSETVTATITITNTGKYAGEETAQLYITDPVASVTRAVKDLKGFKKVFLQPGEKKELRFTVSTEQLKFYNSNLTYDWEPGQFIIHVGTNSANTQSASLQWDR